MKRKFRSYADCEKAYEQADRNRHTSAVTLNAVIRGDVHWIKSRTVDGKFYRAGVIDPNCASGGYVVVVFTSPGQKDSSAAYYLEDWLSEEQRRFALLGSGDPEQRAYRDLITKVAMYRTRVQRAA